MANTAPNQTLQRLHTIQQWMLDDQAPADLLQQCRQQWGWGHTQARRYILKAHQAFIQPPVEAAARLHYHLQRRQKLLRCLDKMEKKAPAEITVALNILKDMAELEGLYALKADRYAVEVTDPGKQVDYSRLSQQTLQDLLDAIS